MLKSCFETIKIQDNQIFNLPYHNKRFNNTRKLLFGSKFDLDLADIIDPNYQELTKCKITYNDNIIEIIYTPYIPRQINSFRLVEDNSIIYDYKFTDRQDIDKLYNQREQCDDVIIFKNGLVTDISIANIAVNYKNRWITPKKPLLKGTFRQELIKSSFVAEYDITREILEQSDKFAIINAMIGFKLIDKFSLF